MLWAKRFDWTQMNMRSLASCLAISTFLDRKSTRLNSSHGYISYAVFCLKKKKHTKIVPERHPYLRLALSELPASSTVLLRSSVAAEAMRRIRLDEVPSRLGSSFFAKRKT